MFKKLLGINWRTTTGAIIAVLGLAGNIYLSVKKKDFLAAIDSSQMLMANVGLLATTIVGLSAKDASVTGVGSKAAEVDSKGTLTTADDKVVGQQPPA